MIAINRETIIEIIKKSDVCLYEKSDNDRLIEEIKALSFIEVCEDCVSREDAMSMIVCYGNEIKAEVMDDIKASMIKLPPVTPTHSTCKDCRHREGINFDEWFCAKHGNSARDDFYCADFERRKE